MKFEIKDQATYAPKICLGDEVAYEAPRGEEIGALVYREESPEDFFVSTGCRGRSDSWVIRTIRKGKQGFIDCKSVPAPTVVKSFLPLGEDEFLIGGSYPLGIWYFSAEQARCEPLFTEKDLRLPKDHSVGIVDKLCWSFEPSEPVGLYAILSGMTMVPEREWKKAEEMMAGRDKLLSGSAFPRRTGFTEEATRIFEEEKAAYEGLAEEVALVRRKFPTRYTKMEDMSIDLTPRLIKIGIPDISGCCEMISGCQVVR